MTSPVVSPVVDAPTARGLPEGWRAAPVWAGDANAPLRLCAVVRQTADPAAGALVSLGERPDALIYLGCIADAGGRPHEWLEWWVQTVDRMATVPGIAAGFREAYCNALLDAQWTGRAEALGKIAPESVLQTGWENAHPPPLWLDPARWQPVSPTDAETGAAWTLCRDDDALRAAGLPPYNGSLHRYLWLPPGKENSGPATRFLATSDDAPDPSGGPPLQTAAEAFGALIPFNPAGGLMIVRAFQPLEYEQFADLLGGAAWKGLSHGKEVFPLGGIYGELARLDEPGYRGGRLFGGGKTRAGQLPERFHLKISLLLGAMRAVRAMTAARRMPLLNLTAASFRVALPEPAADLPFLWNARASLRLPGEAVALPFEVASGARPFLPGAEALGAVSLYRPVALERWISGPRTVRLRKFHRLDGGKFALEGTFVISERAFAPTDLLRFRLRLGTAGLRIDLHAQLDPAAQPPAGPGEAAFRSLPQTLPSETIVQALAAAEGNVFTAVPTELLPLLSSPADLHALGAVAVRTLLVNGGNTLAGALEELFNLVRQAAPPSDQSTTALPLAARLEQTAQTHPRWLEALGPQRLTRDGLRPGQALDQLPAALWWQTLAIVVRLFPGLDPESVCRDCADAPPNALETIYDLPIRLLENLAVRSRALVVGDWEQNREIRAVIEECKKL